MNRSLTKLWSVPRAESGVATPDDQDPPTSLRSNIVSSDGNIPALSPKKRDRQGPTEQSSKRRKGRDGARIPEEVDRTPPKNISLADLGGVDSVIHDLTELIALPMLYPEVYSSSGIQPPRGVLLHGPPGCGKTMIANAFAAELGVSFIPISAPSIISGMSGESEKKLRETFDEAKKMAPCLMFIDEIDAITPKRESAQREMEKRIVAQMLTCMDDLALDKTDGKPVIIIAATNRPDSLDPALRRAGRFNKEINLSVPDEGAREKYVVDFANSKLSLTEIYRILKALTKQLRLSGDFDFRDLAKKTPGFVGADLSDLVSTAGVAATKRVFEMLKAQALEAAAGNEADGDMELDVPVPETIYPEPTAILPTLSPDLQTLRDLIKQAETALSQEQLDSISITNDDFLTAIPKIQPSSKREGFATIPDTKWSDIGALHSIRDELQMAIVEPIKRPERYEAVGITAPTGVLLWGPPGCGKTLLAKAVANESRANFISVKGPELLNKYVGESERAVRQVFTRARSSVPCVIFFDELDALVPRRDGENLSEASSRVVNTLLTELDGLGSRAGIYVIAATNRPDIIDPAMLRPGRLGTLLFVDLPEEQERVEILRTLVGVRKTPIGIDVDLESIARDKRSDGLSGADLDSLLRSAGVCALRRDVLIDPTTGESEDQGKGGLCVTHADFEKAFEKVGPSVTDREKYRKLATRSEWGGSRRR
jgi:ribosome biogenesis ATPase